MHGTFRRSFMLCGRPLHGSTAETAPATRFGVGVWKAFCFQDGRSTYLNTAAYPTGFYPRGAIWSPDLAGEMSAGLEGTNTMSANLFPSKNLTAAITGLGEIIATASLVVSMAASLTGAGALSATITGRLNITASLTGSGAAAGAMAAIASMSATVTGSGSMAATISAIASMSADIVSTGSILTTANVGPAVWSALAASNNLPGTMGEKLNSAGSAGDPWSTVLPGSYSGSQAGALFYQGYQLSRNRVVTNPATGVMTVYADDNTSVLFTANVYNDAGGSTPYDGTAGINRKDRLT